ncbi:saccharopine dehydrogenase NADP-binding domain-containing protein [Zooshikella sp. WH53]|uniref:Saccharopine dehydrogenase NADP-binding domain-containing protein n=1 Tax=Zooshikella harenae TaxID=2827238 RepID=A0ABS5ZBZ9_9GAMM|nr:saccharopine dehydrogenase NADP-binding domain-containing protein [Zooshikella harenae]
MSSIPGLKSLIKNNHNVIVWNRSRQKAIKLLEGISGNYTVKTLVLSDLQEIINVNDIVVSMLPSVMHIEVAKLCLNYKAHFVSSSYLSKEMLALNEQVERLGLCFVNEIGLDPGLDHVFGKLLVSEFKQEGLESPDNSYFFKSYCGGFPKNKNDFCYQFSWSPLGVLKALKATAKYVQYGILRESKQPYKEIHSYSPVSKITNETFEAYGNRNSLDYIKDYNIPDDWQLQEFIRGTLRLSGWSKAWKNVFSIVENSMSTGNDFALEKLSEELKEKYTYSQDEYDRVVLSVELKVVRQTKKIWHKSYFIDATGTADASAMSRLVSLPVSFAVESVLFGEISPGVSGAPNTLAHNLIRRLEQTGEKVEYIDALA